MIGLVAKKPYLCPHIITDYIGLENKTSELYLKTVLHVHGMSLSRFNYPTVIHLTSEKKIRNF